MTDFITEWFSWFEKGIDQLDQKEKEKFFRVCGMHCVETGIIKLYKDLYDQAGHNFDTYFTKFQEMKHIGGKVITPGKVYEITYPDCYCDLYTKRLVQTDVICECSRQSILYVLRTLNPELEYEVVRLSSVISGDKECRFKVTIV